MTIILNATFYACAAAIVAQNEQSLADEIVYSFVSEDGLGRGRLKRVPSLDQGLESIVGMIIAY